MSAARSPAARSCRPRSSPSPTPAPTSPRLRTRAVRDGDVYNDHRQQDLDHPSGARRPDDAAGAHQSRASRATRASRCCWPKSRAARTTIPFPAKGMIGRRDRGARLSRHEGIRDRLRRLRGAGRQPARRRRGPGLQAADADLRSRRASRPRRAPSASRNARSTSGCATPRSACSSASRSINFPRVADKIAMMAVEIHDRAPAHLFRRRARRTTAGAATSKPAWPSCSARASPGRRPTTRCRSMAATASRSNIRSSRVLCDARILNIFEGAAEIQAQVIARRLLEGGQLSGGDRAARIGFSSPHMRHAGLAHAERVGGDSRNVDDAAADERPAIDDGDDRAAAVVEIDDPHVRAERQRAMRGDQAAVMRVAVVGRLAVFVGLAWRPERRERRRAPQDYGVHRRLLICSASTPPLPRAAGFAFPDLRRNDVTAAILPQFPRQSM